MTTSADLATELEPLRAMLAADGYALAADVSADGHAIVLEITATAQACADCLAPAAVIAAVARSCLRVGSALASHEIDVHLPVHPDGAWSDQQPRSSSA